MLRRLFNWIKGESDDLPFTPAPQVRRRTTAHAAVQIDKRSSQTESEDFPSLQPPLDGYLESQGPGKNVLVQKKYIREDTGTYEALKIVDDADDGDPDAGGIDPYNSGQFDRSRHWDRRFRS